MSRIVAGASRDLRSVPGVGDVAGHVGRAMTGDQVVDVNSSELWVSIRSRRRLRRDEGQRSRPSSKGYPGLRARRADLREAADPRRRRARRPAGRGRRAPERRPRRADRRRPAAAASSASTARTSAILRAAGGTDAADADSRSTASWIRASRRRSSSRPWPSRSISAKAQRLRDQAGRRAPRGGHAAVGHPGRQPVRASRRSSRSSCAPTPEVRRSLTDIRGLLIDAPGGGHVRLGDVADVRVRPTPAVIQREASSRRIDVTADVQRAQRRRRVKDDVTEPHRARSSFPLEYHARGDRRRERRRGHRGRGCWASASCRRDRDLPAPAGGLRQLAAGLAWRS